MHVQPRQSFSKKVRFLPTLIAAYALVLQPLFGIIIAPKAGAEAGIQPCAVTKNVVSTDLAQWDLTETRTDGHSKVVKGGLRIWTDNASSQAKAAGYYSTDFALSSLGDKTIAQSIDYQTTKKPTPGLQLKTDFDGNGTIDGILVGEAVYGNNWWLSNGSAQFVKDAAPNNGGGNGSNWYGTPAEWVAKFSAAKVKAIGYSLGSGVHGEGVIKRISLGCTDYTFNKLPPTAPTLISPENEAIVNGKNLVNQWSKVDDAEKYVYESYNDAAATKLRWREETTATQKTAKNVANGTVFWWRVKALDSDGTSSEWSPLWKVTIDSSYPQLVISQPANGEVFGSEDKQKITVKSELKDDQGLANYHIDMDGQNAELTQEPATKVAIQSVGLTIYAVFNAGDFKDGEHTINVSVTDKAGNTTKESRKIIITDSAAPIISTKITDGQVLKGTAALDMSVVEAYPKIYNIRVLDMAGNVVKVDGIPQEKDDPNNTSRSFVYDWDTTKVEKGTYKIQFSATDAKGYAATIYRTVTVDNTPPEPEPQAPTVTINEELKGRVVSGLVSNAAATFSIKIDGITRNIAPTIGEQVPSGGYEWSFAVPNDVSMGEAHELEVIATASGKSSEPAKLTFTIPLPQPTTPSEGGFGSDATNELTQLGANLLQPFTIPTSFGVTPLSSSVTPATESLVLGTKTSKNPSDTNAKNVAVAASENGWKLFGVHWYWWASALGGIGALTAWLMLRAKRAAAGDISL